MIIKLITRQKNIKILKPIQSQTKSIIKSNWPVLKHKPIAQTIIHKSIQYRISNKTKINFDFAIVEQIFQMFNQKYKIRNPYVLFAHSIFNSDYEWYLHKSTIKEMYDTYNQIIKLTKKHSKLNLSVFDLYMYPQLITKKDYSVEKQYGDNVSNDFSSNNQFEIQKKVKLDHYDESNHANKATQIQNTVYSTVNFDSIMNHIYKNLEERFRYDRLKKGF